MQKESKIDRIIHKLEEIEQLPLALVTMAGPWLTPLIPAWFVAVAIQRYLNAPVSVAIIAGLVLEVVGIAGLANATRAYMWNKTKRKTDEPAPVILSVVAVSIYFVTALLLTVILEFWGGLAAIAPGMFIILSVSSGLILVLSSMQRLREKRVRLEKQQRKQRRKQPKTTVDSKPYAPEDDGQFMPHVSGKTRRQALIILTERPDISGSELGRELRRSNSLGRQLKRELLPMIETEMSVSQQNGQNQ